MDVTFSTVPKMFGAVHLSILAGVALASVLLYFVLRGRSDRALVRLIFVLGCCMIAAEIFKQWFVYRYLYRGTRSMWFFPWQLCSMAMYVSFALPFLKGKARDAVLVFLCTCSAIGAIAALILPEDMMRPQIVLFCHSFLYHGAMLVEGLAAMLLLVRRRRAPYLPCAVLFLCMAAVAEVVNVVSHVLIPDPSAQANMFYITPFSPSTQLVFRVIAERAGVFVEILVYLGVIALGAFVLYQIESLFLQKSKPERSPR